MRLSPIDAPRRLRRFAIDAPRRLRRFAIDVPRRLRRFAIDAPRRLRRFATCRLAAGAALLALLCHCNSGGGGCPSGPCDAGVPTDGDGGPPQWSRWTVIRQPQAGAALLWGLYGPGPAQPDHFFAVGTGGTILEAAPTPAQQGGTAPLDKDGMPLLTFTPLQSGTTSDLTAIHGTGPSDIYAVGLGATLLHFDGTAWHKEQALPAAMGGADLGGTAFTADLWGVYAYSNGAVTVGQGGAWAQRNSKGVWQGGATIPVQSLASVWGTAANNIYAVGTGGYIFLFNGTSWQSVGLSFSFTTNLSGIFGSGPSDVFVSGLTGSILHKTTGQFVNYGALVNAGCGNGALPQGYFRHGIETANGPDGGPDGQVVVVGWEGTVVRLGKCKGDMMGLGAWNETGATQQRLEGIWSYAAGGKTTIYIAGAGGVVLRGSL